MLFQVVIDLEHKQIPICWKCLDEYRDAFPPDLKIGYCDSCDTKTDVGKDDDGKYRCYYCSIKEAKKNESIRS